MLNMTGMGLFVEGRDAEGGEAGEELLERLLDFLYAALFAALDIERHLGIVQGHAQQCPAMREHEAHAFVVRLGQFDAICLSAAADFLDDLLGELHQF